MPKVLAEKIIRMEQLAADIFKMTVESEYLAQNSLPGQFVNIKCSEGTSPLLRRPVSICNADRNRCSIDIVFQVKGSGTELLSRKTAGSEVDLLGPLGKGFDLDERFRRIAVVGGGIGTFPLLYILNQSRASDKKAYLGFRNNDSIVLKDEFEKASTDLSVSTDDGSNGNKGFITEYLDRDLDKTVPDIIYACGPQKMLKAVVSIADRFGIPSQVSLEQRMGCGIGACLVCACRTKFGDEWEYSHVCKDGPVFWSSEVIFDE